MLRLKEVWKSGVLVGVGDLVAAHMQDGDDVYYVWGNCDNSVTRVTNSQREVVATFQTGYHLVASSTAEMLSLDYFFLVER